MKYNIIILLTVIFLSLIGCGDTPVFTEMATNRLTVVIKGTFETESGSNFVSMNSKLVNYDAVQDNTIQDINSVDDVTTGSDDSHPNIFMLDIAELRLDKHKFANYRTIIEASLDNADEPFFDGTGIVLKNDDPGEGNYDTVKVYIRKMVFDKAQIYESDGNSMSYEEPAEVIFHENDVNGFDFNQLQVNSYWDSLRLEGGDTLRNFPLRVPIIGGLDYNKDNEETVLEIRLVIKNFVKKYEYDYYNDGVFKVCHYYALSDWLRDVRAGENDIGRNIHAVARAYVPGKTGSVTVTAAPGSYVIAIPSDLSVSDFGLADTFIRPFDSVSVPVTDGAGIRDENQCDLPDAPSYPGNYIEAVLDYYLKYEKYKYDFNDKIATCPYFDSTEGTDFANYTQEWDAYENAVDNFKIPPYVYYCNTGTVVINDMAPGTYNFYEVAKPSYGSLFMQSDFSSASPVTITTGTNPTINL